MNTTPSWLSVSEQSNQKTDRRSNQTILQRRHTGGQKAYEEMLNITNYQRKANQNYNEAPPHTSQNSHQQKVYTQ